MVVYNLICKKEHRFEGWFPNYEEFQKQAEKKLISCPTCGTTKVEKLPHACAVHVKKEEPPAPQKKPETAPSAPPSATEFKEMLQRPIHGTATAEEREALVEEGIPHAILPKPELDS
jgi:hypothetical protein